jgi:DMSO/TMAO reductase YedYZ molybdopterin-dependent catalytic subunit
MPAETRVAVLECAGNSRVFLVPKVPGAQWGPGAVGNAEWTGVPLSALLERADLEEDACEIVLEVCVATLDIQLGYAEGAESIHITVPRKRCQR